MAGIVAALLSGTVAHARPSVFVRAGEDAWYERRMEARVLGKAVGQITAERLSLFIARTREYYAFKVCALEPVEKDTYVGLDRATQAELDAAQRQITWRVTGMTPDGRQLVGHAVLFEACDDEELRGAALLVTDETTNEILMFHPLGTYGDGEDRYPAWVIFPSPKRTDEVFGFSDCTECGNYWRIYYDVSRRKVYTEYNGH